MDSSTIRRKLAAWYDGSKRDLPWRRTRDPYAIWISEIMLQQTRVAAVIPYYERFLKRFPDPASLAAAPEDELLTMWSGLGYYSRARNLRKAAQQIVETGKFPSDYDSILKLAGVGEYTAAAIASIAFGLPHAVVDGNVKRVIARLMNDAKADSWELSGQLLDRRNPARSNQALMELGATVCLPRSPLCESCPIANHCAARKAGLQHELPPKKSKREREKLQRTLLLIRRNGRTLLVPSPRVRDFWELPEPFRGVKHGAVLGEFSHTIMHWYYRFSVQDAVTRSTPKNGRWFSETELRDIPLSTATKKALRIAYNAR